MAYYEPSHQGLRCLQIQQCRSIDEVAYYEPPHQGLRCLQIQLFSSLVLKKLIFTDQPVKLIDVFILASTNFIQSTPYILVSKCIPNYQHLKMYFFGPRKYTLKYQ